VANIQIEPTRLTVYAIMPLRRAAHLNRLGRRRGANQMAIDWRIQAATTTASDLPAAYPGGPSHPAGSVLVLVSQVTPRKGPPITFPAPSAAALALNLAAEAARSAETFKSNLQFGDAPSPDGTVRNLRRDSTGQLFDYFEKCLVSVVFSVQALETYSNYKLADGPAAETGSRERALAASAFRQRDPSATFAPGRPSAPGRPT
jgi:hypothetical protein